MSRILGLVLAGGLSRRFGTDKALAEIAGRPLIAHVTDRLTPHVEVVALVGRSYLGLPHIEDRPRLGLGPLGGLNGGLHYARTHGFSHVLTTACDIPNLPADALAALAEHAETAVLADHPVVGLWPVDLADRLDLFLAEDSRHSMRGWMQVCGASALVLDGVTNINRVEDLDAYLATLPEKPSP